MKNWLDKAGKVDATENTEHGPDRRGDETQGWMADKQQRLARIRAARAALEAEAKAAAAAKKQRAPGRAPRPMARPPSGGAANPHAHPARNALPESINGLYKTEVIRRRGPWRSLCGCLMPTTDLVLDGGMPGDGATSRIRAMAEAAGYPGAVSCEVRSPRWWRHDADHSSGLIMHWWVDRLTIDPAAPDHRT